VIPARLLEDLSAAAPRTRELAAAGLGDLLRSPGLDPAGTRQAVAPLLEYALNILATTYDPAAIPMIETYLRHPDPQVRAHATEARSELPT
jgi:hypothetical protein